MEFVYVNNTIKASRIGLGTWAIGGWMWGGSDEQQSISTILTALDIGISLIDTAPAYGFGLSEEIVGKALKMHGQRDKVVLATKVGLEWQNGQVFRNSSKNRIQKEIEDSLKRLQTDYIDIYQIHWPDETVELEETASTMLRLYEQGKIRAIGVSNYSLGQMDALRKFVPLHSAQPPFNLYEQQSRKEILPYCYRNNIKTLLYGSLCRGLLSGRMKKDTQFEGDDLRKIDPKFQPGRFENYLKATEELDKFAKQNYNKSVIHLAIRWILDQKGADIALIGARKPSQLLYINELFDFKVSEQDSHQIDLILNTFIKDPIGPEFMAPPHRPI
ncbi:putative aldo/keto reductase [Desulfurella amilsii]|uniref:Putative aldo/keto reductase n=1 Tax=Desulfurella amilsii TaxID=1562698 RepID=A0A1X4XW58_9BACT|nr:aldo/keto reductase [Desulfurella amilsii]OSS41748.1 putative aldo/keto reductase [Desulfurella amilsii]